MQIIIRSLKTMLAASLFLPMLLTSLAAASDPAANVTGKWNVVVNGPSGSVNQTIELKQDGDKITGRFKGPRQSGPLEGSIDGNKLKFRVKAFVPLEYAGTVNGDTMSGTSSARGQSAPWTATRAR